MAARGQKHVSRKQHRLEFMAEVSIRPDSLSGRNTVATFTLQLKWNSLVIPPPPPITCDKTDFCLSTVNIKKKKICSCIWFLAPMGHVRNNLSELWIKFCIFNLRHLLNVWRHGSFQQGVRMQGHMTQPRKQIMDVIDIWGFVSVWLLFVEAMKGCID